MESGGHASGGGVWGRQRSPQQQNPAEPLPVQPGRYCAVRQSSSGIVKVMAGWDLKAAQGAAGGRSA